MITIVFTLVWALLSTLAVEASTLKLDFQKSHYPASRIVPRDGHAELPLLNADGAIIYLMEISLGTPPQQFLVQFDTGSSNLWVQEPGTKWCEVNGCKLTGTFDANSSSTFQNLSTPFSLVYGIGKTRGVYVSDVLHLGSLKLPNITFGLAAANSANQIAPGIIGAGFTTHEATAAYGNGAEFPTFLDAMVQTGAIGRRAFSMYLDDENAQTGSILFGGIDDSKYKGDLATYAMAPNASGVYDQYRLAMTGVNFTDDSGKTTSLSSSNMSAPALLDSGTSSLILPSAIAAQISKGLGVVHYGQDYYVDCAYNNSNATISFQFGGSASPSYAVPISQIIAPAQGITFKDGAEACQLYMMPASDSDTFAESNTEYILGDPFLRGVYAVFDQDAHQISLAQAVFNKSGQGTVENLPSGSSGISAAVATYTVSPTTLPLPPTQTGSASSGAASGTGSASAATQTGSAASSQLPTNPPSATFSLQTSATASSSAASSSSSNAAGRSIVESSIWNLIAGMVALGAIV